MCMLDVTELGVAPELHPGCAWFYGPYEGVQIEAPKTGWSFGLSHIYKHACDRAIEDRFNGIVRQFYPVTEAQLLAHDVDCAERDQRLRTMMGLR
jgi:hypothetical protein